MHYLIKSLTLCILFLAIPVIAGNVEEVSYGSLPDSVKKTTLSFLNKKQITKINKIYSQGHIRFKIESGKIFNKKNFIAKEIVIANNGKLIKVGREVPYFALSVNLMDEIEQSYPGIKVEEVESIQQHYFDVSGEVNGQEILFRILEDGTITEIHAEKP